MRFQVLCFHALLLVPCAAQTCVDSPLAGKFKKGKYFTCKKIKQKKLCSKKNLDSHCPVTCETCDEYKCEDTLVKFVEDGKTSERDCAWVEKKVKCGKDEFAHTCRKTCGYCGTETGNPSSSPSAMPSTSAPTPGPSMDPSSKPSAVPSTSAPTPSPSMDPSSDPSSAPSSSPTIFCDDSKLKFKTKSERGKTFNSLCSNLETNDELCALDAVTSHCPVKCGGCDVCVNSSCKFQYSKEEPKFIGCEKADCDVSGVFHSCRATCGACISLTPSESPSMTPSSDPSASPSNMPSSVPSALPTLTPSMTPSWVPTSEPAVPCVDSPLAGKFKKGKYYTCKKVKQKKLCSKKNLDSHCPATCEACEEYKCEDTLVKFVEDGKTSERDCAWVEKKNKCGKDEFSHTCRKTCGYCS